MIIQVAKKDLEAALSVARESLGGKEIYGHFLFRVHPGTQDEPEPKVEVMTYSGGRLFSSCPLKCVVEGDELHSFTVEGKAFDGWVKGLPDVALDMEFHDEDGAKFTNITVPGEGDLDFESLDPNDFPFWDDMLASAKQTAKVPAARLAAALEHAKAFAYDRDTERPEICVVENVGGLLYATNTKAATIVEVKGLEESQLRLHGAEVRSVVKFLGMFEPDGQVELLEHPQQGHMLRRADGAVFGASLFQAQFPDIGIRRDTPTHCWFVLNKSDLRNALRFLTPGTKVDDNRMWFDQTQPAGPIVLAVESRAGKRKERTLEPAQDADGNLICGRDEEAMKAEGLSLPKGGFKLDYPNLEKVLDSSDRETIRFDIWIRKKGSRTIGMVKFSETRNDDAFLTIMSWLR